jgi:preprotein translocase subunit SecD
VRLLRIVPDDTKFDFMRFRRISFPISALMSILAISLYFFHGLNFGIDFKGGTLIEVQTKANPADLAKMRTTIGGLHLGDFQLQLFGAPDDVLIYERIREEVRGGRTAINAIDAGFSRALATILDSNITTFIAAAVLFYIGTGPVRGFAVTLGVGILTTLFTAFTLTRLIVAYWVRWWRPRVVPI